MYRLAAIRRTQAGDATDQWRDQWNADISQGSVATHLRSGGIFSDNIITSFSRSSLLRFVDGEQMELKPDFVKQWTVNCANSLP